jgi:dTDP-4-amino-4,6-dideoxygalactose transaminase
VSKLAIDGGIPVRDEPFMSWPPVESDHMKSLEGAFFSGIWGIGSPNITLFEESFADYQDAKYCLSIMNGTWAIWVALKACGVKYSDEVIIPPYTFIATAAAVVMANATPIFVDIDPETYNIDPAKIEEKITPKTKAIIPVHIAGNPADMDRIMGIAKKHNIKVIEDAAQAHLAEYNGIKVGAIGDCGTFSFQSSKNISAGEGGALITNDEKLYSAAFSYQNCGRKLGGEWYDHHVLGSNMRMTAFQAALISAQLREAQSYSDKRNQGAAFLNKELININGITPLISYPNTTNHSYHLYIFKYDSSQFNNRSRDWFLQSLNAEGIPCHKGYNPLYREPLFQIDTLEYPHLQGIDYAGLQLPECEKACDSEAVWIKQNVLLANEVDLEDIMLAISKIQRYA